MTIGERIKARRKELGMSVDELAEKLGKNRATVYRYERNDIEGLPANILENLANALETTPEDLMGWYEKMSAILEDQRVHVNQLLPYLAYGVATAGDEEKYIIVKTKAKGDVQEAELKFLLIAICGMNDHNQVEQLETLRYLSQLLPSLDRKAQEQLISYADYLAVKDKINWGLPQCGSDTPESHS